LDANAAPGTDTIDFAIQGTLPSIELATPLPQLTDPVDVDGTTQPGYQGTPLVRLLGFQVAGPGGPQASGLVLAANGCTVIGLQIQGFPRDGISVQSSGNSISANVIESNGRDGVAIFNDATGNIVGNTALNGGNVISDNDRDGVEIYDPGTSNNTVSENTIEGNLVDGVAISGGASFNTIGGPPVQLGNFARNNLISGNHVYGVRISGPTTTGNVLESNWIGLDVDGRTPLPNSTSKIAYANVGVLNSPDNQIGSTNPGMQNVISGCQNDGIQISGLFATGNLVEGNWIGTDATGTAEVDNNTGITIRDGASNNVIGGSIAAARNVVSGNSVVGIVIANSSTIPVETTDNQVLGNWIGLSVDGEKLGSQLDGIFLDAPSNQIGGPDIGDTNVISGNAAAGVYVAGTIARNNRIQGNLIGTNPGGNAAVGNGFLASKAIPGAGIVLASGAVDNLIGGTGPGEGNVISGNITNGILVSKITGTVPFGNVIQGNYIGINKDGTEQLPNTQNGIELAEGATDNLIGGTDPAARNYISGNTKLGVYIHDHLTTQNRVEGNWIGLDVNGNSLGNVGGGLLIYFVAPGNVIGGAAGAGNVISGNRGDGLDLLAVVQTVVQGNLIGTDPTGLVPCGNQGRGVAILGSRASVIGGTVPGAGNLISANSGDGILIANKSLVNYIFGNDVGTDGTGHPAAGMGNGGNGIEITTNSGLNLIGYPGVGAKNVISGNTGTGIVMPAGGRNSVRENAIYANQRGGIRLVPTGQLVATPVLNSVTLNADGHPVVQGTLQGAKDTTYTIEFFANGTADTTTGNGSGELFLNSQPLQVVTDSTGQAKFTVVIPSLISPFTYFLSATATDSLLNTSGFSNYVQLSPGGP
jgi:titin